MTRLTRERVLHLVGRHRLNDHAIAEIIRTGASEAELIEAVSRVLRGGEVAAERPRPMSRRVAMLFEILNTGGDELSELD